MTLSNSRESDGHRVLTAAFFDRTPLKVARDLLGCHLHVGDQIQPRIITETEAYVGPQGEGRGPSLKQTPVSLLANFPFKLPLIPNAFVRRAGPTMPSTPLIRTAEG